MRYLSLFIAATSAAPALLSRSTSHSVEVLPAGIRGEDKSTLTTPASIDPVQEEFLRKYQPLSEATLGSIRPVSEAVFSSTGSCFSKYPCFTVERAAVAAIGDKEEVNRDQVSAILDSLNSTSSIVVTQDDNPATLYPSYTKTIQGATLQIIALPGELPTDILGGLVFDLFKLQSDNPLTNSIRAVQAKTDGKERPFLALCLYPEGIDETQAYNFCIGNELDGSPSPYTPTSHVDKRLSLEGLINFGCGLIQIPLLCHGA